MKLKLKTSFIAGGISSGMKKGYTLIELLVAMVVFLILISALAGVFASSLRNQRYFLTSQRLLDQSSYALEYMSKALRMAKEDEEGDCVGSGKTYEYNYDPDSDSYSLKFKNQRKECQEFSVKDGVLWDKRKDQDGNDIYDSEKLPLLSDDFEIKKFEVNTIEEFQPRVTISFDIAGKVMKDKPRIRLQTTVSQRDLKSGN